VATTTTGETAFVRDIYKLLPQFTRMVDQEQGLKLLERYLQGMTNIWDSMAERIEDLRGLMNPLNIPDAVLRHVFPLLGFGGDLSYVWNALSPTDQRRLIFAAIPLWRASSTEAAIRIAARFLSGKPFFVRGVHDFLPVADDLLIGVSYNSKAIWVVGEDPSPFNMDSIDLHIVDEGDIDHTLLRNLLDITRPAGEKIVIVYADFLDRFRDDTLSQWTELSGSTITCDGDGQVTLGPGPAALITNSVNSPFADLCLLWTATTRDTDPASNYRMAFVRGSDIGGAAMVGYMFAWLPYPVAGAGIGTWGVARFAAGVPTMLMGGSFALADDHEFHFSLYCYETTGGTLLRATIDGEMVGQHIDATPGRPLSGDVAFANEMSGGPGSVEIGAVEVLPQPPVLELVARKLQVAPTRVTLNGGETLTLTGRGGAEDYFWSIPINNSGASVVKLDNDEAEYSAGFPGSTVVDTVRATDAFGNSAEIQVTVEP